MPFSNGGSKMNLQTFYHEGEDASIPYGKDTFLAQTFTLTQETVVWRFRFKSWAYEPGYFYEYALYNTDGAGKPTGAPIATTSLSPTGEVPYSPGKWRRFDFIAFPTLSPGVYAIVASVPTSHRTFSHNLRADVTAPFYTQGKAFKSTDSGATWNELPNTDFMFDCWGYQRPPDPPPPPSLSNWSARDYLPITLCDGYKIVINTDINCHLFMRWTNVEPQIHPTPVLRRGLLMHFDRRFCFVAWNENEQEEPGDTTTHTFIKRNWPVCETRWLYFVGTVADEQQPSTSAIFKLHFDVTRTEFYCTLSNRSAYATSINWDYAHDRVNGIILDNYDAPWYSIPAYSHLNASFFIYRGFLFFDTTGLPPGLQIGEAYLSLFVTAKFCYFTTYPYLYITQGVQADPVIPANYGDQLPYTQVGGQIDIRDITTGQYNHIPLNDVGLNWINPGGITKLCLRSQIDVDDYATTVVGANGIRFHSAQKGIDYLPKLTICYHP